MRNLFRLRIEAPEAYQNQLFTFLDPGTPQGDTRLATLVEWRDRSVKVALEPVFHDLARDSVHRGTIASPGAFLEDLVQSMDAAGARIPQELLREFEVGVVLCCGRSLYMLYSDGLEPRFSLGGPPQTLRSTLRVRVKDLSPDATAPDAPWSTAIGSRLHRVRVFFEDEDRVVVWLPSRGVAPSVHPGVEERDRRLQPESSEGTGACIVLLKEPAADAQPLDEAEGTWPRLHDQQRRDRVTMSYAALVLVVVVFVTALFGMSRWQRIGDEDGRVETSALLTEGVDSSLEPSESSRVSSEVVEHGAAAAGGGGQPELQLAHVTPPERAPLQLLWSKRYPDWVTSSPRLVQGRIVYGCRDGRLYAVDPSGAPLWEDNSGAGIGATPEADGTRLYCGNYAGRTFALRALDGLELWRQDLGARIVASPAAGRTLVFFPTYAGDVVALDKKTGRPAWRVHIGGRLRARPLVTRDRVVVISASGEVICLERRSGKRRWSTPTAAGVISNPLRVGDLVVFGSKDGHLHALSLEDGELAWRLRAGGAVNSSPAVDPQHDDTLFVGCSDRRLYAVRASDGEIAWRFEARAAILSTPRVDRGRVYVTSYDRHSYVLDASNGQLLGKLALGAPIYSSPLVHDGRVYFGSNDGTFYCLRDVQ